MYPLCNVCAGVGALYPRNDWKGSVTIHVRQLMTTMLIESIKIFESFINGQTKRGLTSLEVSWYPSSGIQYKGKTHKDSSKLDEGQRILKRSFLPEHSSHFKQNLPVILPNTSGTIIKA